MLDGPRFIGYSFTSAAFAVLTFWALIVYGTGVSRSVAIAGALFAAISQYIAQDQRAWVASIVCAYIAIFSGFISLGFMIAGR